MNQSNGDGLPGSKVSVPPPPHCAVSVSLLRQTTWIPIRTEEVDQWWSSSLALRRYYISGWLQPQMSCLTVVSHSLSTSLSLSIKDHGFTESCSEQASRWMLFVRRVRGRMEWALSRASPSITRLQLLFLFPYSMGDTWDAWHSQEPGDWFNDRLTTRMKWLHGAVTAAVCIHPMPPTPSLFRPFMAHSIKAMVHSTPRFYYLHHHEYRQIWQYVTF